MSLKNINSNRVAFSLVWKFMERSASQIIQFIVALIIARILSPEEYGIIAIITIFISIATVFVQGGFSTALIQQKEVDDEEVSSVFYFSFLIALIIYILLFTTSPSIASFYGMPKLIRILRVMSVVIFFNAVISIQNAILVRNLDFKKSFISSVIASIVSGVVGVIMALMGFGEWALVAQQLLFRGGLCIILWFKVKWRPIMYFSLNKTRKLINYGSNILFANLVDTVYHNIQSLAIGRLFSAEMLAYFNKGKQFPLILIDNLNGSIQSVLLPTYSSSQDDIKQMKRMIRRALVTSTYLVFPAMIGMATIARPFISLVLTDKWLPAVPFLQIYCFISALFPINTSNLEAVNAMGFSSLYFRLITIKRVVGLVILTLSVVLLNDVIAIALTGLLIEVFATILNTRPIASKLDYNLKEQLKDMLPNFLISTFMGIVVYSVIYLKMSSLITIFLQIVVGIIVYLLLSMIFRIESFNYIINILFAKKKSI